MYKRTWPVSATLAGLIFLLLVGLLAAGCGGSASSGADASALLADAVPPMKALSSFHFTYQVVNPQGAAPSSGTGIAGIAGDVRLEGTMKATVDLTQNGVPLQFQFVATKDTHYVQNPASGQWQSVPAALSPIGQIDLSAGAIQILEKVQEPREAGSESVDGVDCAKVEGQIAAQDIASLVAAADTSDLLTCTLWVGKEDHLVRRIQTVGAATTGEDENVKRVIELSRFNEPVEIEVPA